MHVKQFGSYASLPRGSLGLVAELGAGPWTQTHFLLEARPDVTATKVTLIDPGIDGYLRSGRAIYAGGRLHGIEAELLSIPAERVPASYTERFDTLVMINVIEHTFNAFATLHTAHRLLKRGGIFIFQERDASRSTPGLRSITRYGLPNRSLMPFSPANTTRCSAFMGGLLRCVGRDVLMASTRKFTSLARSAKASMRCEAPQMQKDALGYLVNGYHPPAQPPAFYILVAQLKHGHQPLASGGGTTLRTPPLPP